MSARIVELILSDDLRVGSGEPDDPIRVRRQLFTLDGRLVAWADDGGEACVLTLAVDSGRCVDE